MNAQPTAFDLSEMNTTSDYLDAPHGDKLPGGKARDKGTRHVGHSLAVNVEDDRIDRHKMGPLEFFQYKKAYRTVLAAATQERIRDEQARIDAHREKAREAAIDAAVAALRASGARVDRTDIAAQLVLDDETWLPPRALPAQSDSNDKSGKRSRLDTPGAGALAVVLLLARLGDRNPSVRDALLRDEGPVVLIDVPDRTAVDRVVHNWKAVWLPESAVVVASKKQNLEKLDRWTTHAVTFTATARRRSGKDAGADYLAVATLANNRIAMVGISPDARSCLPECLTVIATHRLTLYPLDAETIRLVIRVITGKPCRTVLDPEVLKKITFDDLPLAIRSGRSPHECMERLTDIVKRREKTKDARDLTLDELHGLDEAVAWAKASLRDLEAFKAGQIGWADIDHGVVLDGPPGTGKTTFAKVFAHEAGLPLITGTLAQWQGSGPGHLGSLLAAMRECFDDARRQAPAIVFIDEIDAFADRSKVTHAHRDYVIEVVNGFLEQLDGLAGREGLIFIAASNDVSRCDPAILRAGRLNRIIHVPLPSPDDLVKMFRVRLRGDLKDVDLEEAALMAAGYTGADVERAVKDARRSARQGERPMDLNDLVRAIAGTEDTRSEASLRRAAVHEAGHALVAARCFGADRVLVTIRQRGRSGGLTTVKYDGSPPLETLEDVDQHIVRLLAGRAAEEVVLGDFGSGAGGGPDSDLAKATALAASMACSFGLLGPTPLLYRGALGEQDALTLSPAMQKVVHDALADRYSRTLDLIRNEREAVEAIAEALLARKTLSGDHLGRIISTSALEDRADDVSVLFDPDDDDRDLDCLDQEIAASVAVGPATQESDAD
jgi:cell division protease FtsH